MAPPNDKESVQAGIPASQPDPEAGELHRVEGENIADTLVARKKLLDAANQFKALSDIVGGPEGVKSFFATYKDTDGFQSLDGSNNNTAKKDGAEAKDGDKKDDKKKKTGAELGNELAKEHKIDLSFQLKPSPGARGAPSHAPDFEAYDSASISIKETKSSFERSMAENGFTSEAIEASVSGGYGGWSGAVSGGVARQKDSGESKGDFAEYKAYTATYTTHPRCALKLFELRRLAQKVADNAKDNGSAVTAAIEARDQFLREYGYIFSTTFQLGGQLVATRSAESIATEKDSQKRDAMKMSAAVSLSGPYASGSVSASRETQTSGKSHEAVVNNTSALAWSAHGGNTLLCANPPAWADSVSGHMTWRVVGQETVSPIPALLSKLRDDQDKLVWENVDGIFNSLQQKAYKAVPRRIPGTWAGRFRLEAIDGRKIVAKDGLFKLVKSLGDGEKEAIFTMADADLNNRQDVANMGMCYADNPVFLVTGLVARDPSMGNQIPGAWVDDNGKMRPETAGRAVCRWSLRSAASSINFKERWSPNKSVLLDNAEVKLFCHSYGAGSYRDLRDTVVWAPAVCAASGDAAPLTVQKFDTKKLNPVWISIDKFSDYATFQGFAANNTYAPLKYTVFNPTETDPTRAGTSVFTKSFDELLAVVRDYDKGIATGDQMKMIDTLRAVVGIGAPGATHEFATRLMTLQPGQLGMGKDIGDRVGNISWELAEKMIPPNIKAWQETEKCEEVTFRIRYEDP
ncbi:hypothetical protein H2202_010943 [Exophiala xenobiotica]|nr:hypothetical protein H2202_010943 [Exophiala xenobiotica]